MTEQPRFAQPVERCAKVETNMSPSDWCQPRSRSTHVGYVGSGGENIELEEAFTLAADGRIFEVYDVGG